MRNSNHGMLIAGILLTLSICLSGQTTIGQAALSAFGGNSTSESTELKDTGGHFVDSGKQMDAQYNMIPGVIVSQSLTITVIEQSEKSIPEKFQLFHNYPNPFNPTTTFQFTIPKATEIRVQIYNNRAELIEEFCYGEKQTGLHTFIWDASRFSSGTYYVKLLSDESIQVQKCLLVK